MATSKFFTVEVKPLIPASLQHGAAFAAGDVLFDWTAVQIPKGSALLRSATIMVKPKGDADPTSNRFGMELLFSSTDTVSLGTVNSPVDHAPNSDFLGRIEFEVSNYGHTAMQSTAVATSGRSSNNGLDQSQFVLTPKMSDTVNNTYATPGYDTVYVGAVATGAFDFISINGIAEAGAASAASTQVITMDDLSAGTSMDCTEHFAVGDVLHIGTTVGTPAADSLIGTVASTAAQQITLEAVSPTELVDGDVLYDINPVKLILSLER